MGNIYLKAPVSARTINIFVLGSVCCMPTILFVSLFLLMRGEREKNIRQNGYKDGVSQQWVQRIDTVWIRKTVTNAANGTE